ncbi:membrane-associated protein, putative [Bodo saltans]|uniref:Membrane-associated protein, putative n=1 Tax=Bodo saltans TaxID=75058 RepID=A0A0S4JF76_BODSA|nr:membrane-associated protein, putative [Bodo saltans]|eukprot:CUG88934.1 membrane-associated protein, putative [Bodo saltans]
MTLTGSFSKRPTGNGGVGHHGRHQHHWKSPGTIAAIFLASSAGFLFVIWMVLSASTTSIVDVPMHSDNNNNHINNNKDDGSPPKKQMSSQQQQHQSNIAKPKKSVFKGGAPWRTRKTIAAKVLLETPWIRVEEHTISVRSPSGATVEVSDWKWIDVSDQVNVLVSVTLEVLHKYRQVLKLKSPTTAGVQLFRSGTEPDEGSISNDTEIFMLFEQEKYGYEGLSFAVVGGLVEPDEPPMLAAQREIHEELGLTRCTIMPLGKYRTDVNRGGGFVNSFLAKQCVIDAEQANKHQQDRANSDLERQTPVAMTRDFLKQMLLTRTSEAVKEVKWCNTIAMALLTMDNGLDAGAPQN